MSYNFLDNKTTLIEGVEFILGRYPYYDRDSLSDNKYTNTKYSIQMILESIKTISNIIKEEDILKIVIFDALIGNSDRHHSNWGITQTKQILKLKNGEILGYGIKLSPLYDNGSSLCSYINESDIGTILKDKMKYESIINTKSKSAIGWNNIRPVRHFELVQNLKNEYYKETVDFVKKINEKITEQSIDNILNDFDDEIISKNIKKLLKKFIIDRKNRIIEIYNLESGE